MKRKSVYHLVLAAATVVMFVTGTPLRAVEDFSASTDDRIEPMFKKTYVYRTYLMDDAIRTEVDGGVATLTGTVTEESHKAMAEETLKNLPGVIRVENQLTVKIAVGEDMDTRIGRRVKNTLMLHRNVNALKTTVEVQDGVVTLRGEASSGAQKDLTAEYAKDIEDVKEVRNEMTVVAPPESLERTGSEKLDDASITAQIRTALFVHRSTRSVKTKVETRDGRVTLTGIAKNEAEKSLVSKLVADIQGVTSVNNQMTVEEANTTK